MNSIVKNYVIYRITSFVTSLYFYQCIWCDGMGELFKRDEYLKSWLRDGVGDCDGYGCHGATSR